MLDAAGKREFRYDPALHPSLVAELAAPEGRLLAAEQGAAVALAVVLQPGFPLHCQSSGGSENSDQTGAVPTEVQPPEKQIQQKGAAEVAEPQRPESGLAVAARVEPWIADPGHAQRRPEGARWHQLRGFQVQVP